MTKNVLTALLRVGLVVMLSTTLLVAAGPAADAKPPGARACEVDAVEEAAEQGASHAADLIAEAKEALARAEKAGKKAAIRAATERAKFAAQVGLCVIQLGILDGYDPGNRRPPKQPGSGPDVPPDYTGPHPKTDGYRIPCLGPNGEQWEIWSDEVCRGPNGQSS